MMKTRTEMAKAFATYAATHGKDWMNECEIAAFVEPADPYLVALFRNSGIIQRRKEQSCGRFGSPQHVLTDSAQILANGGVERACWNCGGRGTIKHVSMTGRNALSQACPICQGNGWLGYVK